jgi:hypothetical protein
MKKVEENGMPTTPVTEERSAQPGTAAAPVLNKDQQPEAAAQAKPKSRLKENDRLLVLGGGAAILGPVNTIVKPRR